MQKLQTDFRKIYFSSWTQLTKRHCWS